MLFLCIMMFQDLTISLDDIGIYQRMTSYRSSDAYFFLDKMNDTMTSIKDDGGIFKYEKAGQGPKELHRAAFFGIDEDKILLVSNTDRILAFDGQLKLSKKKYGKLPLRRQVRGRHFYGLNLESNKFILVMSFMNDPLAATFTLNKQKFQLGKNLFPQPPSKSSDQLLRQTLQMHGNLLFTSKTFFVQEYEVEVSKLDKSHNSETQAILTGTLENENLSTMFPDQPYFGSINYMFRCENGYAVVVGVQKKDAKPFKFSNFVDLFDEDGRFRKRIDFDEEMPLVPVINREGEIFIITEMNEKEILAPWKPFE